MQVEEILNVNLSNWIPGTRLFKTEDNNYFVVDSDTQNYNDSGLIQFIRRETSVLFCDENGIAEDLTPDFIFDPGTTAEQAIAEMNYELIEGA